MPGSQQANVHLHIWQVPNMLLQNICVKCSKSVSHQDIGPTTATCGEPSIMKGPTGSCSSIRHERKPLNLQAVLINSSTLCHSFITKWWEGPFQRETTVLLHNAGSVLSFQHFYLQYNTQFNKKPLHTVIKAILAACLLLLRNPVPNSPPLQTSGPDLEDSELPHKCIRQC